MTSPSAPRPLLTLLALLDARGRRRVALAALVQLGERLVLTASALVVASRGREALPMAAGALAVVMLLRSAARALLALHVRAAVVQALAAARLAHPDESGQESDEAELTLLDGMYASEDVLRHRLPDLLGDIPACLVLTCFLVAREPPALVLAWVFVIAAAGVAVAMVRRVASNQVARAWQAFLPALDDLLVTLHAPLEIVGNGVEADLLARLAGKLDLWRRRARGASAVGFLAGRAPVAAAAVATGLVLLAGGWQGATLAGAIVFAGVVPPFAGVARGTLDLARDLVRAKPVVKLLGEPRGEARVGTEAIILPAEVTCAQLSFSFPGANAPSVRAIDLAWRPGTLLGLAGRNGSGKSTFARLLLGLHAPSDGTIRIGGQLLAAAEPRAFRQQVGYLTQRPYLPERMSVAEAVRLLAPRAKDEAIRASLTRLGLYRVLERRRPEAPLDVKVATLSTGERQRIALARVLLRDAPLLVLDEPDANLDAETVGIVGDLLVLEAQTRMILVIAHSPALLARMNRVLHFEEGRLLSS